MAAGTGIHSLDVAVHSIEVEPPASFDIESEMVQSRSLRFPLRPLWPSALAMQAEVLKLGNASRRAAGCDGGSIDGSMDNNVD